MTNTTKLLRPALTAVLVLALTMVMTLGSAFAIVEISDKFYITDEADVISEETEDYIVSQNGYLEADCEGAQIGVVVVDFLDGMDIEDYCYKLFDQMQLGDADEDNGILLLLTIGEENYWCMTGKGLEQELTAGDIDDILWYNLEPDFAAADYDAGVLTVFDALYSEVCDIYGVAVSDGSAGDDYYYNDYEYVDDVELTMTDWIIFIVFCLILMAIVLFIITLIKKALRPRRSVPYTPAATYSRPLRPRRRARPIIFMGPGRTPANRPRRTGLNRPTHHGGPGMPPPPGSRPAIRPTSRPSSRPTSRPSSARPASRPTSRPSASRPSSRPSRPSGRGGGGMSRGGGAGRRGR